MKKLGPWKTEDFEQLSWHDVYVHGFRFDNYKESEGSADLILDIDFILDWSEREEKMFFTICRAELKFHEVFGFKFNIDYATPTAGMSPFSIEGIFRKPVKFSTGYKSYEWEIPINWPGGLLAFESPGFTQVLIGNPVNAQDQWLSDGKR